MGEPAWPQGLALSLPHQQLLRPRSQDTLETAPGAPAAPGGSGATIGAVQDTKDNIETQLENLCLSVTERVLEK